MTVLNDQDDDDLRQLFRVTLTIFIGKKDRNERRKKRKKKGEKKKKR